MWRASIEAELSYVDFSWGGVLLASPSLLFLLIFSGPFLQTVVVDFFLLTIIMMNVDQHFLRFVFNSMDV